MPALRQRGAGARGLSWVVLGLWLVGPLVSAWADEAGRNRVQATGAEAFRPSVGLGWAFAPDGQGGGLFQGQLLASCDHPAGWSLSLGLPALWDLGPGAREPRGGPLIAGGGFRWPGAVTWRLGTSLSAPWAGAEGVPWVVGLQAGAQGAADPVVVGAELSVGRPWPGTFEPGTLPPWFAGLTVSGREVLNDRVTTGLAIELQVVPDRLELRWGLALRWSFSWVDRGWSAAASVGPGAGGNWVAAGSVLRDY